MADQAMDRTRPFDIREWETTHIDSSSVSLIRSGTLGRDSAVASMDLPSRVAELCTNLPPPPIPPWIESSPERLRLLVANCSCWKKYTELCPDNLSSQNLSWTRMEDLHSNDETDDSSSPLLPFLAAITVGFLMVGIVAFAYFWRQRKRRRFSCTAKFLKQPSPTRDYCSPNFYLTPSVTVETQLSLCALEDNIRIRPYSIYKEEAWSYLTEATPRLTMDSSIYESMSPTCLQNDNEVLLKPSELADNVSETVYTSPTTSYGDNLYSSHSLPVESVRGEQNKLNGKPHEKGMKCKDKIKQKPKTHHHVHSLSTETNSPFIQVTNFSGSTHEVSDVQPHQNQTISYRPELKGRKGVMRKCRDARNRVLDRLSGRYNTKSSAGHSSMPNSFPLEKPIRALRLSLKGFRSLGQRRLHRRFETPGKSDEYDHAPVSASDYEQS